MSNYTSGCEFLVRYTCGRCGKKHTEPSLPPALINKLPEAPAGWMPSTRYTPLLCDTCAEAFKSFLRGDPAALPLNISPQTAAAMQEMDRQAHGFYFDEDAETSGLLEED